jgi:protein-S-isoprenylcysteine O-methyltransferase Ste14
MFILLYSGIAYVIFFGAFLYSIAFTSPFLGDFAGTLVPKTIDSGATPGLAHALIVDSLLLGLFAIQHSVMARPGFKAWWTRIVPPAAERSTYVLLSSLILILMFWKWEPMPQAIWSTHGILATAIEGAFFWGWLIVLLSTFMLSHFELFGLTQAYRAFRDRETPPSVLRRVWLYKLVRHPIMLGFLIAFWSAPTMTLGHLVFALATTGYIFVGVKLEERDLVRVLGDDYRKYREEVSMLLPLPRSG